MKITSKDDFLHPALKMSSVVLRQTVLPVLPKLASSGIDWNFAQQTHDQIVLTSTTHMLPRNIFLDRPSPQKTAGKLLGFDASVSSWDVVEVCWTLSTPFQI